MSRPARNAAFQSVVEHEQIPPPRAPVGFVRPWSMKPPGPMPGTFERLPTVRQKSNFAPAGTTVPLMMPAGTVMFAPMKFRSLAVKPVVQAEILWTFGARSTAIAVVKVGSVAPTVSATDDVAAPSARLVNAA